MNKEKGARTYGRAVTVGLMLLVIGFAAGEAADTEDILAGSGVRGGLAVVVGGDAGVLAELHAGGSFLVQGLSADPKAVAHLREELQRRGLYGPVSVVAWDGGGLPYAENLVRLLVVTERGGVPRDEMLRVLCPGGVALVQKAGRWQKTVKPWPEQIGEWTHYLHDASGNAVSEDRRVGSPRRLQWRCEPPTLRSHEINNSIMNVVTADGRLFYFQDEGPIGVGDERFPQKWSLVARDAFSGVQLWRQPMGEWGWPEWVDTGPVPRGISNLWGSPLPTNRRMVVDGGRLYVTLDYRGLINVLDAKTGERLAVHDDMPAVDEIVLTPDGILVLRVRDIPVREERYGTSKAPEFMHRLKEEPPERVVAMDARTGEVLWETEARHVAPETLAAHAGRVCYHNYEELVCLDLEDGRELWRHETGTFKRGGVWVRRYAGTTVLHKNVALFGYREVDAFDLDTGEKLWHTGGGYGAMGFYAPGMMCAIGNHVFGGWGIGGIHYRNGTARERTVDIGRLISPGHHQRCYRSKATVRYLLNAKRGVEFIDLEGDNHMRNDWVRSTCGHGMVPANGLLYAPPHPCKCYTGVQLNWFNALAANPDQSVGPAPVTVQREASLRKGPAYDRIQRYRDREQDADASGWPMYRRDPHRSGRSGTDCAAELEQTWRSSLGGRPTQPVVVGDGVFVAVPDEHRVLRLDAESGRTEWTFAAGGAVDSSPTIINGLAIFGCRDGWVYCLDAADGELAWRFRAAPEERRIINDDRVESPWPVHGSVLAYDGLVYCAAGISSYLDGGIFVYALDPYTGRVVYQTRVNGPWPDVVQEEGHCTEIGGTRADLLVAGEGSVHMMRMSWTKGLEEVEQPYVEIEDRQMLDRQTPQHLIASGGLLDGSGFNRTWWTYSKLWQRTDNRLAPKQGALLAFNEERTYAAKIYYGQGFTPPYTPGENQVRVVADLNHNEPAFVRHHEHPKGVWHYHLKREEPAVWDTSVPVRVNSMMVTGDVLFVAGPPDVVPEDDPLASFEGRAGGRLLAVSASDGRTLSRLELDAPPVWDGMSAAGGRLFLALEDGTVIALQ